MAMLVGHWELRGFGMWAVQELTTADLVGRVGFYYPEGWPDHEIAWALARPFWGRGYATEAASAALGKAFGPLGWPRVVSLVDPANTFGPSRPATRRAVRRRGDDTGHRVAMYALAAYDQRASAGRRDSPEGAGRGRGPG